MAQVTNVSGETVDCPLLGIGAIAPGATVEVHDTLAVELASTTLTVAPSSAAPAAEEGSA